MHNIGYMTLIENVDRKGVLRDIQVIAREGGDGYHGSPRWHDEIKPLRNYNEAQAWIEAHDNGWYDDHAVRYYDHSNAKKTKKIEELERRLKELFSKKNDYIKAHSVKNLKAALITCPKCGSKLSREHLRSESCPLCYTDLRSKTTLDTIKNYERRQAETQKQIEAEKEKQNGQVKWLLKYEYHS